MINDGKERLKKSKEEKEQVKKISGLFN